MAKASAAPPPAALAPAPRPSESAHLGPNGVAAIQSIASERDVDVIEWGNGEPASGAAEPPPAMARGGIEPPGAEPKPQKGEPDHLDEQPAKGKPDAETPEAEEITSVEVPKETAAEKRQRALDNLAAEKRARTLEKQLQEAQGKLTAAEKATLGELLKARGVNKDDLLEKLLAGTDDLELPAKLEPAEEEKAALKKRVDDLAAKLAERDERDAQRQIQEGVRIVEQTLGDAGVPLPLIDSLGKYEDVMNEAYRLYTDSGNEGTALDFLPKAAETVELKLRKANPRLAALADAAAKAGSSKAAAAAITEAPRSGITRRTAARPNGQPKPLPLDPFDRDRAIRAEFGWKGENE